jgi:hypothetical protein
MTQEILQAPGQINLNEITLFSFNKGVYINLLDYLVEVNLYESIFDPVVTGSILLSDSRNLTSFFPLVGDEYLFINVKTPTLTDEYSIYKTFRIFSVENKNYANDGSTIIYELGIMSSEGFNDVLNPIYKSFEGTPSKIINDIFIDYIQANRNISLGATNNATTKTPLYFLEYPANKLKFISPGWTPIQCINWLAGKCLPPAGKAANFLFWETTKGFYFGSMDNILSNLDTYSIGEYVYSETYIKTLSVEDKYKSMYAIKDLSIETAVNQLDNSRLGYLASVLLDVDVYNKTYEFNSYDHSTEFDKYAHLNSTDSYPLFDKNIIRNPFAYGKINYSNPKLFTKVENNFDQIPKITFGNRRSNLLELNNFKMQIVIPGRTDVEVGNTIKIVFPKGEPGALTSKDKTNSKQDMAYTGYYLITNLSHKINPKTHFITMNVVKDSFSAAEYNKAKQ